MKKLLTILGAVGLMATTSATVVACGNKENNQDADLKSFSLKNAEKVMGGIIDDSMLDNQGIIVNAPIGKVKSEDENVSAQTLFTNAIKELLVANGYKCPDEYIFNATNLPTEEDLNNEDSLWMWSDEIKINVTDENGTNLEIDKNVNVTFERTDLTKEEYSQKRFEEKEVVINNLSEYAKQDKKIWLTEEQVALMLTNKSDESVIRQAWFGMFAWGHGENRSKNDNRRAVKDFEMQDIKDALEIETIEYNALDGKLEATMKITFNKDVYSVTAGKNSVIKASTAELNVQIQPIEN